MGEDKGKGGGPKMILWARQNSKQSPFCLWLFILYHPLFANGIESALKGLLGM